MSMKTRPIGRRFSCGEVCSTATQGTIPRPDRMTSDREAEEQAAINAVLETTVLDKTPRLAILLAYIREQYFEDDSDAIKECSIATGVFHLSLAKITHVYIFIAFPLARIGRSKRPLPSRVL